MKIIKGDVVYMWKKIFHMLCATVLLTLFIPVSKAFAQTGVLLYTPHTGLTVSPGETLTYDVSVINESNAIKNVTFQIDDLPKNWESQITANGNSIRQLSVKPNDEQAITLEITIPLEVKKNDYRFQLIAKGTDGSSASLPFLVAVSEEGSAQSNLTTDQPNREGHADSTFSYSATLKNYTAERQNYALSAQAPEGWGVQFKVDGEGVTSISLEPNESKVFDIEVTPAENVKSETYTIPITATSGSTSSQLELEAHITGKYSMKLTTPDGNLSTKITAGKERKVELVIENDGTADITDISLSAETPPNWQVSFDEDSIPLLKAGEKTSVFATIHAADDAIAGDYVTSIKAESAAVSSEAVFRISVKTSVVWGFFGAAIILAVIGGLYYIFRKYGRR